MKTISKGDDRKPSTGKNKEISNKADKLDYNEEEDIQEETRPKVYNRKRFQKNHYIVRHSLLDDFFENSTLNNSILIGFYHLGMLLCAFFLITHPIVTPVLLFSNR